MPPQCPGVPALGVVRNVRKRAIFGITSQGHLTQGASLLGNSLASLVGHLHLPFPGSLASSRCVQACLQVRWREL